MGLPGSPPWATQFTSESFLRSQEEIQSLKSVSEAEGKDLF